MEKTALLYDASQAVISTFDLDEVLRQILAIVCRHFDLQHVAVLLYDPESQRLKVRIHSGWNQQSVDTHLAIGQGLIGTAAASRQPVYVPDVDADSRYICSIDSTHSELALPLLVRDEMVGVLDCQSERLNFFNDEAIALLKLFSAQASIAIQNARLYSTEQRRAAQLEAINAIARQTTALQDIRELLDTAAYFILHAFPVDHVSVLLREENGGLSLRAHKGRLTPCFGQDGALAPGVGLCAQAMQLGRSVVAADVRKVAGYAPGMVETRSEMCVPLISFGETLGVIVLDSASLGAFGAADVGPLESAADICASAVQNARYVERVRHLAYVDGLTGMYNRRYFEIRVLEEIERAKRYQGILSLIMIDLDKFKKLNDEFGHLLGDEVLRQFCSVVTRQIRKADVLCRYGGEEFVIIAPETAKTHAVSLAEKLQRVVAGWHFPGVPYPVTFSAGVASAPQSGDGRDQLVAAADAAMYAAKQAGGNRVCEAASTAPKPSDARSSADD